MSMRDEIRFRVEEGRLIVLEPALPTSPVVRTMLVAPNIADLLNGPWSNQQEEYRFGRLRSDFDAFIEGLYISACMVPYSAKTAYIASLDPPAEGVWEIRSRDPKPSLRVFGFFAEVDVFIALTIFNRNLLGGSNTREWRDAIVGCKAEWRKLFSPYQPLIAETINEYISAKVFLV